MASNFKIEESSLSKTQNERDIIIMKLSKHISDHVLLIEDCNRSDRKRRQSELVKEEINKKLKILDTEIDKQKVSFCNYF